MQVDSLDKSMNDDDSSCISVLAPNNKRKRRASKSNPNIVLSSHVTDEAIPVLVERERNSLVTDEVFRERVIDDVAGGNSPSHFNALTNSDAYNTGVT